MDPGQICDNLLSCVKSSNLNFSLNENPFSVSIYLKKTFVRGKNGYAKCSPNVVPNIFGDQINESHRSDIIKHEVEQEASKDAIYDLDIKLQKAKGEIEGLMFRNNQLEKDKEASENALDKKESEVAKWKLLAENLKSKFETLEKETKSFSKTLKSKNKESDTLIVKNENLCEKLDKSKKDNDMLLDEKNRFATEIRTLKDLQRPIIKLTKSTITSPITSSSVSTNTSTISTKNVSTNTTFNPQFRPETSKAFNPTISMGSSSSNKSRAGSTSTSSINHSPKSTSPTPSVTSSLCSSPPMPQALIPGSDNVNCHHVPQCTLKQPKASQVDQPKSPSSYPPSHIRLLPLEVSSLQDFRELAKTNHECEECEEGALFNNFQEIVYYPDPGLCGGTSGSPVKSCPNNQNSRIVVRETTENIVKFKWRNFKCKQCDHRFSKKANLNFHIKRKHRSSK